ncbi:hypothetical protein ABBQ38_015079 [Trebouxia sp. C0009 RCD-2024]
MAPTGQTITVPTPSDKEIAAYPREYALFKQLDHSHKGEIPLKEATDYVKKYGSASVELTAGEVPFEQLAKALHKKGSQNGKGNTLGYAAQDSGGHLSPFVFDRRSLKNDDVCIQITHCGICHSDLHQIKNEWGASNYPMVPGHEIVGIVTAVGSKVNKFKVGDRAGVGCMVDSCNDCHQCKTEGEEQFCSKSVQTYNMKNFDGTPTHGGYSTHIVVVDRFVLHLPENLPMDASAPLLCAGITTYSPLKHYGLNKAGMKIGVVGLGGLGHMAVKIGKAMGLEVTVFSTTEKKRDEALSVLKADHFVVSKDEKQMQAVSGSLDGIIDTVSAKHPLALYLQTLKVGGVSVMLGVPDESMELPTFNIIMRRLRIGGSPIGGVKETQEMLDFCSKHDITCEIETIDIQYVNTAMERLMKNDVHYRFVIDVQGSLIQ